MYTESGKSYTSTIPRIREGAKNRWVSALLTPSLYQQGQGCLREHMTYWEGDEQKSREVHCCLGVAGDECPFIEATQVVAGTRYLYGKEAQMSYLPVEVRDWLGLVTDNESSHKGDPVIFTCLEQSANSMMSWTLAGLNDGDNHLTFEQIADVIRYFL